MSLVNRSAKKPAQTQCKDNPHRELGRLIDCTGYGSYLLLILLVELVEKLVYSRLTVIDAVLVFDATGVVRN